MDSENKVSRSLISSDGIKIPISEYFINCCTTLKSLYTDQFKEDFEDIEIKNFDKNVIEFIIKYNDMDKNNEEEDIASDPFITSDKDKEFFKDIDPFFLRDVLSAADFFDYPRLRNVSGKRMARFWEKMSIEEIRNISGQVNDYTPEEEEKVKRQHQWLLEED